MRFVSVQLVFLLSLPSSLLAKPADIQSQFTQSLKLQSQSQDFHVWDDSPLSPKNIFLSFEKDLAIDSNLKKQICSALFTLKPMDLGVFTEQIEVYGPNLPCFSQLTNRLKNYWLQSKIRLQKTMAENLRQAGLSGQDLGTWGPSEEIITDTVGGPTHTDGGLKDKQILLTFDDGPHPTRTPELLKTLDNENVQVNFFMVGKNVRRYSSIVEDINDAGHEPGNHSWSHLYLPKQTRSVGLQEITDGFEAIFRVLGFNTPFFRYPYGGRTADTKVWLQNNNVSEYFWNIDSLDWKIKDPAELYEYTLQQIEKAQYGIVLFHDIQPQTILMMPELIKSLNAKGYTPVVFRPLEAE